MPVAGSARRARAIIDLGAARHNLGEIRRLAGPDVKVMPAVKADAYGHGAVPLTRAFAQAGADGFCVATPEEGVEIREAAGGRPVLLLGITPPEDVPAIVESGVQVVAPDVRFAELLSRAAVAAGRTVGVHLKVDTGMGRIGVQADGAVELARMLEALPGLDLVGVMTHFPTSDSEDLTFARQQFGLFKRVCGDVCAAVGRGLLRHCANSGAILQMPEAHLDAVRPGIIVYGCYPSDVRPAGVALQPVMSLAARIVFLKDVPAGFSVSYGRTWRTERPSRIATVSIGYGDGLPRLLSSRGQAIVRGHLAPIAGRVCMDQTMLDVTDVEDVQMGDEVIFWGRGQDAVLPCEDVAALCGTIPYELTCGVAPRVPREYIG